MIGQHYCSTNSMSSPRNLGPICPLVQGASVVPAFAGMKTGGEGKQLWVVAHPVGR
jgi:hypothetical protein